VSTTVLDGALAVPRTVRATTDHSRIPELDGVRAIAIWGVLLGHIFYGWKVSGFEPIPGFVMQVIGHGWLGVDLFFILSGFLITGILLDTRDKPRFFRNFYARRFLRIMPLYFCVVFVFFIFYSQSKSYFILSTFFAANLANMFHVGVPHGPGVLWSLAVEEHFYLLWPLLVWVLNRRMLAALAICIIVLTPIARGIAVVYGLPVDAAVYSYSWFRFDGLALGALLALWVRSPYAKEQNSYRFAGLLIGLTILITVVGAPFGLNTRSALGTALRFTQAQFPFAAFFLVVLVRQGTSLTGFLRHPFARLSGNLSYCLYMIHLALGDGYQALMKQLGYDPNAMFGILGSVFVRGFFIIAVSFILAMLSRKFLEEPFLSLKRYF